MNWITILGLFLAFISFSDAIDPLSPAPTHKSNKNRSWRSGATMKLWYERNITMGYTPLKDLKIPGMPYLDLKFKDESESPSGNLKHRFAWALYLWALTEGYIEANTTVYEASSGNTATSEAYMAKIIGVQYVAVIPDTTEQAKIDRIEKWGGRVHKTAASKMFQEAADLAKENHGFYMNQFANANFAEEFHESGYTDWESSNVFHEIVMQMLELKYSVPPDYFIHSAGTGGTISSVGRYIQKYQAYTKVVLADTQFSMYYDYVLNNRFNTENDSAASLWVTPGMAGTGFGYAGPGILGKTTSLVPNAIDIAYKIPDLASTAAMQILKENGLNGGTSSGINFITALSVSATAKETMNPDQKLIIATLLCDSGDLYESSYYNETWIAQKFEAHGGLPIFECWKGVIRRAVKEGLDPLELGGAECKHEVAPITIATATEDSQNPYEVQSTPDDDAAPAADEPVSRNRRYV